MPGPGGIRWTKAQRQRLDSAVRSYNAALGYARKANPGAAPYLPKTVSYKELFSEIETGQQLNRVVKSLRRGGRASAFDLVATDSGDLVSKWTIGEARIAFSVRERRKSMERRRRGIEVEGGIRLGNMRTLVEENLRASSRRVRDMTAAQLDRMVELGYEDAKRTKARRASDYYTNYVAGMQSMNYDFLAPDLFVRVASIIHEIMEKDPQFLIDVFERGDERLEIVWVYDDLTEFEVKMTTIRAAWESVYREYKSKG